METENKKTTTSHQTKKMSRGQIIIAVVAVVILAVIGWVNRQPATTGEPFIVTVDGTQIVPGQTTVQELLDAGFIVGKSEMAGLERVFNEYDTTAKVDKKSYLMSVYVNKGDQTGARVEITNFSPNAGKPMAECVVTKVDVWPKDADRFNILIGSTPFSDFKPDTIIGFYPQAEVGSDSTVVKDKHYRLDFDMADGAIEHIFSSYDKTQK